ncbi:MAG: aminopeptidase P family protein [Rhodospirillales bacterium]|nr:aminopeptidase P family protein [Rhodospirillales bacterium]
MQKNPPARGFSVAEFESRLARAQTMMTGANFDALLLSSEAEVRYFTGFLTQFWQSPTRPWFVVVPKAGKPIAVIPEIGAPCMGRTWVDDIRTWSSPDLEDDGVSLLGETLREVAGQRGKIGLPMGHETHLRMPLADFDRLRSTLDDMEFSDATAIVRGLRMVKSEAEIGKITHACELVSNAFDQAPNLFRLGQSEAEVFRAFKIECLGQGVDDVSYLVGGAGPGGYNDIISPPSGRVIVKGDILILDTGCTFDGYFCDFDRNFAFGHASDGARRAYEAVYRATEAGLMAARPGATCADVFEAMGRVMDEAGALGNTVGRVGHGLGMQLTEWPSLSAQDKTVLEAAMVITLEPGMIFAPGKVMVHEENIVIREGGAELLSRRAASELLVID